MTNPYYKAHAQADADAQPVPIGVRLYAPSRFTAWFDLDEPAVRLTLQIFCDPSEGTAFPRCVSAKVDATVANDAVTGDDLRRLRLAELVRVATVLVGYDAVPRDDGTVELVPTGRDADDPAFHIRSRGLAPARRGMRRDDTDFRKVAEVYQAANDRAPTVAVANEFHVSRPTAARYVARAREMGLLEPYNEES